VGLSDLAAEGEVGCEDPELGTEDMADALESGDNVEAVPNAVAIIWRFVCRLAAFFLLRVAFSLVCLLWAEV